MSETTPEQKQPRLTRAEHIVAVKGGGYFPVLILLQDGSLGAVVRGGAPHIGVKGRLDWIHSQDGGRTWSAPATIVDSQWDDRNPALGQMPDGTIALGYGECSHYEPDGKWNQEVGQFDLYYVLSKDNGRTWSPKQPLDSGPIRHSRSPYGRIIVLPDRAALMTVYGARTDEPESADRLVPGGRYYAGLIRSRDNGRTWGDFSFLGANLNETSLGHLPDGRLLAFARTDEGGSVWEAESRDLGYSWTGWQRVTQPKQHPADVTLLQSGHLLLTYGNRIEPFGAQCMLSRDGGKTWDRDRRTMVGWTSLHGDCGYPSTVQLRDGTIVTIYYSVGTRDLPDDEQAIVVRYAEEMIGR